MVLSHLFISSSRCLCFCMDSLYIRMADNSSWLEAHLSHLIPGDASLSQDHGQQISPSVTACNLQAPTDNQFPLHHYTVMPSSPAQRSENLSISTGLTEELVQFTSHFNRSRMLMHVQVPPYFLIASYPSLVPCGYPHQIQSYKAKTRPASTYLKALNIPHSAPCFFWFFSMAWLNLSVSLCIKVLLCPDISLGCPNSCK